MHKILFDFRDILCLSLFFFIFRLLPITGIYDSLSGLLSTRHINILHFHAICLLDIAIISKYQPASCCCCRVRVCCTYNVNIEISLPALAVAAAYLNGALILLL